MSDIDSIYFVYRNGAIYTDVPASEIESDDCGFCFTICGFDVSIAYDDLYAIGIMTEDGCEVLWRAER